VYGREERIVEVQRERVVAAPPEAVWPLVDDPEAMGAWFAFADRMELVEGSGVGRRQRLHGHWGGKRSEIDQEVVDYAPGHRLAWRHVAERLDGRPAPRFAAETRFTIELEPVGEGTLVRMRSEQRPASVMRGLVMRAFGGREISAKLEESLAALAERAA
jgi:uncharacterized protein YndB with AHSA1/START domain